MVQTVAMVSADSRRVGRIPVDRLLDEMKRERDQLIQEKTSIEHQLSLVEDWKRQEMSKIYLRRLSKSRSIEATTHLEVSVREKKAPLMDRKLAVEQRLRSIKSKFSRAGTAKRQEPREDVVVLLRIEKMLSRLVAKLDSPKS